MLKSGLKRKGNKGCVATPVPAGTANLLKASGNVLLYIFFSSECSSRGDSVVWP